MLNLNFFLEKLKGKWHSHQTIYFISSKKVKNYKNIVTLNDDYFEKENGNKYHVLHTIDEKFIDGNFIYSYIILSNNCIKISSESKLDNIKYIEYMYFINQNLRISITYLINIQKRLAVSFNSYIKQASYLS